MSGHMALNQSWQGIMENIFEMEKKYSKWKWKRNIRNGKEIFEMPKTINF